MKRVLITGATGFVGRALCEFASQRGYAVRAIVRPGRPLVQSAEQVDVGSIGPDTNWATALEDVDIVCHVAAIAHLQGHAVPNEEIYFRVNALGTKRLAEAAANAGVKRVIYLSSVKVNGEMTTDRPYRWSDTPAPQDAYGRSKWQGEQYLHEVAGRTGIESVILRPPLVYGPGVKANFRSMMYWLRRRVPLPLGAIDNLRSLVALDNLVDLVVTCMSHPAAANQTFLVSDGEDVSTTQLLRRLALALGVRARLVPIAPSLLKFGAALVGRQHIAQRLCDSLQVDISHTTSVLGWTPPISMDEALRRVADGFLREASL